MEVAPVPDQQATDGAARQRVDPDIDPHQTGLGRRGLDDVDIQRLVAGAHAVTALLYLALTPIGALLAVWVTASATRPLVNWRIP
jgi:hypothetical protein